LIKYFIGPMSKNVVDTILELGSNEIGFIPSRRQVDYIGGYVNNWTTKEFSEYVNGRVVIERDHGGVGQGYEFDDGLQSFKQDAKHLDIIHIDPWKCCPALTVGLQETINCIYYIDSISGSKTVKYEVGTEESIRRFEVEELEQLLQGLKNSLRPTLFDRIEYAVVQSGVGLDLGKQKNTGTFNPKRLEDMVKVCKKFGKKSKEHNGDYLSSKEYKDRFDLGLDSINIAPEFGQLETLVYLDNGDDTFMDRWYKICYDSKRWEKWVSKDFIPKDNKEELIKICGHYVLSDEQFNLIKPDIDDEIKKTINNKLLELLS
tara:strand:+ start:120 stop:1070 length:951 start_codon:yes stop_codon:yes gene_type:complete